MEKKPSLLQKLASAQYMVWSVIFIIAPLILVVYMRLPIRRAILRLPTFDSWAAMATSFFAQSVTA